MGILESFPISEGINFRYIKDSKFKSARISVSVFLPLSKETASINALLLLILKHSCKKYPSFLELNKKLESLYGASLDCSINKIGENQVFTIVASGIDDKYIDKYISDDVNISRELASLVCNILCYPDFESGLFKDKIIEQERRQLLEILELEFNDKRTYARNRLEELMCKDELFGINKFGTKEEIKSIDNQTLVNAWENMIRSAKIEILMLGECTCYKEALDEFKKAFSGIDREYQDNYTTEIVLSSNDVKEYVDEMDVVQSKLVLGFRAGTSKPNEDIVNAKVMTALFGGTPSSKLFLNVREKLSLCYYCSSSIDLDKGIIVVESGVESKNIDKAKEQIISELNDIKEGKFSEEDLEAVKLQLINSFVTVSDYIDKLIYYYMGQLLYKDIKSLDEMADLISKVKKEDIIESAKKVSLDTVYVLKSK